METKKLRSVLAFSDGDDCLIVQNNEGKILWSFKINKTILDKYFSKKEFIYYSLIKIKYINDMRLNIFKGKEGTDVFKTRRFFEFR